MNCDELQQLTALQAVGGLDGDDAARLSMRLDQDAAARAEFARFLDVAAAMAGAVPLRRPSAGLRARVLERIARTRQQTAARGDESEVAVPPGFQFVRSDAPWLPSPIPGTRLKILSAGPSQDHVLLMVEIGAGVAYPEHEHLGVEDMFVLSGDLQTEGRTLGPGDLLHAEPGTHHHELWSVEGCRALMVVPKHALAGMVPL